MMTLMLCYLSIAPSAYKDISASAICLFWRFNLVNWCIGRPAEVPLAALVVFPVILRSTLLHRGYSQRI